MSLRERVANWIAPADRATQGGGSFSAALMALELAQARGTLAGISAAEEVIGGFMLRCFAAAQVEGVYRRQFPRRLLKMVARDLLLNGESVYYRHAGQLRWAADYSLDRGVYKIHGREYLPSLVFHPRYIEERETGRGVSPLLQAARLRSMARQVETIMENESRAASSYVVPIPNVEGTLDEDGKEVPPEFVKNMKNAKGRGFVAETPRGGFGQREHSQPSFEQTRLGMDTPANVSAIYEQSHNYVLNAMGAPNAMYNGGAADLRDSVRLVCGTLVKPVIAIIEDAARECGLPVTIELPLLADLDLAAKVRALQGLIASGHDIEEAMAIAGIPAVEE